MNREQKAAVIEEVAGQIASADAIFAVDYRGITVAQVKELRVKLQGSNTKLRVVKNSLTERAADQAGAAELKPLLAGPTALALVQGDAAAAAKTLSDTNRTLRLLDFKGGYMNGSVLSAEQVQSIARLPSREVLHAQLVGTIASPISGLVRTLNALIQGLAVQLGQIAEQGLVGGGSSSASAAESSSEAATRAASDDAPSAEAEAEAEPEPEAEAEAADAAAPAEAEQPAAEAPTPDEPETGASDEAPSDEQ